MVKKIWDEIVGGVKDILRELASDEVLRDTFGIQDNPANSGISSTPQGRRLLR